MTKRDLIGYLALLLALIGCAGLIWYAGFAPHQLKIAVYPPDTGLSRFLTTLSSTLEKEGATVRLTVLQLPSAEAVDDAIRKRRADLAIIRSDLSLPPSTLSVAAFQEFLVLTIARADAGIANFGDLSGKRVAIVASDKANAVLFRMLARQHGIDDKDIKTTEVPGAAEVAELAEKKQIDAAFAVAPRGGPQIARNYDLFAESLEKPPVFIPLGDIKGRPAFNPAFTKTEINAGEIRAANPRVPEKTVRTITFPAVIVARSALPNASVQEFTKNLFAFRLSLSAQFPVAGRLTALPTKRDSPFPLHPGAAIYYDASEVTFLEKYSDLLWLSLFGFSGIASVFVWFWRLAIPKTRLAISAEREKIVALIRRAREARSAGEIDNIQREADDIVVTISEQLYDGTIDPERQPSFDLLLARLDSAIEARRETLHPA
ncbi:MAG: TAXI family TRAP transporter solute-binding subunit [Beijerinckiaceae bacterium]